MILRNKGVSREARDFLNRNGKKTVTIRCKKCGEPVLESFVKQVYRSGLFGKVGAKEEHSNYYYHGDGTPVELHEYTLEDDSVVREGVQEIKYAASDVVFLYLADQNGETLFMWSDKDMADEMSAYGA